MYRCVQALALSSYQHQPKQHYDIVNLSFPHYHIILHTPDQSESQSSSMSLPHESRSLDESSKDDSSHDSIESPSLSGSSS